MSTISQSDVMAAIEKALDLSPGSLKESSRAEEISSWDSLGQLSVLAALDKIFIGKIAQISEMAEADSVPKILQILRQHSLL